MRGLVILILTSLLVLVVFLIGDAAPASGAIDPLESLYRDVEPGMSKALVVKEVNSRLSELELHDFSFLISLFWKSEKREDDTDLEGKLPESRMMLLFEDGKLQCVWYGFSYNNNFKERRVKGTAPECDALR